ncbi:MAG: hypothetical protein V1913_09905 [Fibrobacterota bacterium]
MTRTLLLCLGLFVSAAPAALPDSLLRVRDSLLAELKRTENGDYSRTKELSEKLNALEKKATPVPQGRAENMDVPPQDLFQLQALHVVLKARLQKCEAQQDSLMGFLTELHFKREGAFPENRGSFGADPRENMREAPWMRNPDIEKQKTVTVQRIDSLKTEIKSLTRQMEANKALIQSQLKGGQP